jgi:glutaredoxin-related protein
MTQMKIIMYGADICSDCVEAKEKLAPNDSIELDYRDITKNIQTLKELLSFRDHDKMFTPVIEAGGVGIPFFILDNNSKTFEVKDFLEMEEPLQSGNSCSIDGKGC